MNRYLIESATTGENIAVIEADDELHAFERVMKVQHLLRRKHPSEVEHLNILLCLPNEPMPAAPSFTAQYFKLHTPTATYTLQ